MDIDTRQLQEQLLDLQYFHHLLEVPVEKAANTWLKQPSQFRRRSAEEITVAGLLAESEGLLMRWGQAMENVVQPLSIIAHASTEEDSVLPTPAVPSWAHAPELWSLREDASLVDSAASSASAVVSSAQYKRRQEKRIPRLLQSVAMTRYFRHELITLTHDSVESSLCCDSQRICQKLYKKMVDLGLEIVIPDDEEDDDRANDVIEDNGEEERKEKSREISPSGVHQGSRPWTTPISSSSTSSSSISSSSNLFANTSSFLVQAASQHFAYDASQTNILQYWMQGLIPPSTTETKAISNGYDKTTATTTNQARSSNRRKSPGLFVCEVSTGAIYQIPPLELTYCLFYAMLHLLPTLHGYAAAHRNHVCLPDECLICLLMWWSRSFDSHGLWNRLHNALGQTAGRTTAAGGGGGGGGVPIMEAAASLGRQQPILVHFVTSMTEDGQIRATSDEKVDIAQYLQIVEDLLTFTAIVQTTTSEAEGERGGHVLQVDYRRPPFDALFSTASVSSEAASASSASYDHERYAQFHQLPLRVSTFPSQETATTTGAASKPSAVTSATMEPFLSQFKGTLNMSLLTLVAIRSENAPLLWQCLTAVDELLASSAVLRTSEVFSQILEFLSHPPPVQEIQVSTWMEVFQQHLLPLLFGSPAVRSLQESWALPLALWMLRRILLSSAVSRRSDEASSSPPSSTVFEGHQQSATFLSDLLMGFFQPFASPFVVRTLMFPSSDLCEGSNDLTSVIAYTLDCLQRPVSQTQRIASFISVSPRNRQQTGDDHHEDDGDDESSQASDGETWQQLRSETVPFLMRYHQYLVRYLRYLSHEEDVVLGNSVGDDELRSLAVAEESWYAHVYRSNDGQSSLSEELLVLSLLLARWDDYDLQVSAAAVSVSRRHTTPLANGRKGEKSSTTKKNKHHVMVRSLIRKALQCRRSTAMEEQLLLQQQQQKKLCHQQQPLDSRQTSSHRWHVYDLHPTRILELCEQYAFLEGMWMVLESLDDLTTVDRQTLLDDITGRRALVDVAQMILEECRSVLVSLSMHDTRDAVQHHESLSRSSHYKGAVALMDTLKCLWGRYIQLTWRWWNQRSSRERNDGDDAGSSALFLWSMQMLVEPLESFVSMTHRIIGNDDTRRGGSYADADTVSARWMTIGPQQTLVQHLAEWSVYVLAKTWPSSTFGLPMVLESGGCSEILSQLSEEYVLYLQQQGLLV